MKKITDKALAAVTALLIAAVCIAATVLILFTPDDLPQMYPDNTSGNLLSGGRVAGGEDIVYFTEQGKVYSLFGDKVSYLTDGQAPLFATNGGVVYSADGALYQYLSDTHSKTLLLDGASHPLIIGRWIYYVENGELVKTRMDDGKTCALGLKTDAPFTISTTLVYYIGEDGRLYSAKTDGSDAVCLTQEQVQDFILGGNHIFYRDTNGVLNWFAAATPQAKVAFKACDAYNYVGGRLIYSAQGRLCAYDMAGKLDEAVLAEQAAGAELYCDDSFVYLPEDGALTRMAPDGSGKATFKTETVQ